MNGFDAGPVPIGGVGSHGIACTCLQRDFPCPFHFRDNEPTVGDQIRGLCDHIFTLIDGHANRKTRLVKEIRKRRLLPLR